MPKKNRTKQLNPPSPVPSAAIAPPAGTIAVLVPPALVTRRCEDSWTNWEWVKAGVPIFNTWGNIMFYLFKRYNIYIYSIKFSTVGSVGYIFSALTPSFCGENHFDPSPTQSSHSRGSNSAVLKIYLKLDWWIWCYACLLLCLSFRIPQKKHSFTG